MKHTLLVTLLLSACAPAMTAPSGARGFGDRIIAAIKTTTLRHAREEIARSTNGAGLRLGVYLDSLVGPTPDAYFYEYAHAGGWIDSVVASGLVDGAIGPQASRRTVQQVGLSISIGEPYPLTRDTVEIVYAWCVRRFPTQRWAVARGGTWRDALLPSDTGWVRVRHSPAMVSVACAE